MASGGPAAGWTGEPAFTCLCADPGSGPSEKGEHRPIEWGRRVRRGIVFYPGGSAVWPQCWLCAVCAVGRVSCCVGGGYPVGVSISSARAVRGSGARPRAIRDQ